MDHQVYMGQGILYSMEEEYFHLTMLVIFMVYLWQNF